MTSYLDFLQAKETCPCRLSVEKLIPLGNNFLNEDNLSELDPELSERLITIRNQWHHGLPLPTPRNLSAPPSSYQQDNSLIYYALLEDHRLVMKEGKPSAFCTTIIYVNPFSLPSLPERKPMKINKYLGVNEYLISPSFFEDKETKSLQVIDCGKRQYCDFESKWCVSCQGDFPNKCHSRFQDYIRVSDILPSILDIQEKYRPIQWGNAKDIALVEKLLGHVAEDFHQTWERVKPNGEYHREIEEYLQGMEKKLNFAHTKLKYFEDKYGKDIDNILKEIEIRKKKASIDNRRAELEKELAALNLEAVKLALTEN